MTSADEIKELLADSSKRIKLYDFVLDMTEELIHATSMEHFPTDAPWTDEEFQQRIVRYEEATSGLCEATAHKVGAQVSTITIPQYIEASQGDES